MNADEKATKELEERARALLGESVTRVDARVRSRLNQARHAALEEMAASRRSFWRGSLFMPATGAVAAAVLVALVLNAQLGRDHLSPLAEGGQAAFDDIEMLADADGLDLLENWDSGFYEWAAAETEASDGTSG
jgi:anti-sigma-K factor RskA